MCVTFLCERIEYRTTLSEHWPDRYYRNSVLSFTHPYYYKRRLTAHSQAARAAPAVRDLDHRSPEKLQREREGERERERERGERWRGGEMERGER